ncbi:hypothetical protein GCM10010274_58850 [Streptomyces lavendofoliae]|uniref:Uncharacterized protein n=1 Tax=Streptomyces lavendofoliae TaxID=67314 RepID=A0A918I2I9_9ACTN|nr:hypothetical protein GCM10010274_58850 [Streptomyces lavendofoliae]
MVRTVVPAWVRRYRTLYWVDIAGLHRVRARRLPSRREAGRDGAAPPMEHPLGGAGRGSLPGVEGETLLITG